MLRIRTFLLLVALLVGGCGQSQTGETATDTATAHTPEPQSEEDALHKSQPAGDYGESFTNAQTLPVATLVEDASRFEGKRVTITGTVAEVCPMRGCWMDVEQDGSRIRVKVVDGDIVFPLSAKGHGAQVEGVVERIELDEEEARGWMAHEAEEKGETFDPASVTGPMTIWRLQGKSAKIDG